MGMNTLKCTMDAVTKWIALLVALIGLTTAIISLKTAMDNKEKISELESCCVEVTINGPEAGDHVSSEVDVYGTTVIDERCRYVFIIVRGTLPPVQYWKIADLVQVNRNGQWAGKVLLDEIPVGEEATIEAQVSSRPDTYRIGQRFSVPPTFGSLSDIIRVRRVQ